MKFFLIVTFLMANTAALDRPMYVFKNPSFDSMKECKEYVSVMHMRIYQQASHSYNYQYTPEAIYCLTQDAVKEIFEYNYGNENKTGV
tara:strand:- start:497 stop:760 length:264 start_codon:yes stop_codon:yes gene_type:complete